MPYMFNSFNQFVKQVLLTNPILQKRKVRQREHKELAEATWSAHGRVGIWPGPLTDSRSGLLICG